MLELITELQKTCRKDRAHQDFCSQNRGMRPGDVELKKLCWNLSMCDPSQNDWLWNQASTCEKCRWTILGLIDELNEEMHYETHELPYERLQYRTKKTADLLKVKKHFLQAPNKTHNCSIFFRATVITNPSLPFLV
ncbi:hypothetical protein Ddc_17009 [Ditylenchus destructor]|nr:hypothetical protein Ddc_17009 [Ditylenchus destructor]